MPTHSRPRARSSIRKRRKFADNKWAAVNLFLFGVLIILLLVLAIGFLFNFIASPGEEVRRKHLTPLEAGRKQMQEKLESWDPDSIEIIEERLMRPGLHGGEVGYYVCFRGTHNSRGQVEDQFYTEIKEVNVEKIHIDELNDE